MATEFLFFTACLAGSLNPEEVQTAMASPSIALSRASVNSISPYGGFGAATVDNIAKQLIWVQARSLWIPCCALLPTAQIFSLPA